jgi:hypothetical protein
MVAYENHCIGCDVLGMSCIGASCVNRRVPVFYCDKVGCVAHTEGADSLFIVAGMQLCLDCVMDIAERNGIDPEDLIESEVEV